MKTNYTTIKNTVVYECTIHASKKGTQSQKRILRIRRVNSQKHADYRRAATREANREG
jgi:hypothetical protein